MACTGCPCAAAPTGGYRHGQRVQVRGLDEILSTLDADGTLDGLPFMPEMARFCGRTFPVHRRAAKTCVEGLGVRRLSGSGCVFLKDVRCDGADHDGCQRACLIFWKEAWLRPAETQPPADPSSSGAPCLTDGGLPATRDGRYFCQSTELAGVTQVLPRWNLRHYLQDLAHGEVTLPRLARVLWRVIVNKCRRLLGRLPQGQLSGSQVKPSKGELELQPGEWVEIKSRAQIEATLDSGGKNRGLFFEAEMLEHCGRRCRVAYQVRRIISEETAKMVQLTNTVVLDGVACEGLCAKNCPRSNYFYWREIWLRRVG
jgi:hypothetical protein